MNEKLFSVQAAEYANYRPVYPTGLFEFIAGECVDHQMAWDSGTGNGQAASFLADHFEKVYATDISLAQIERAFRRPAIEYKVEAAEQCSLHGSSLDVVTAATAAHWFNLEKYYLQVNRILKPGGVLAIWSYADCTISPKVDEIVKQYHKIIKPYWDNRIKKNLEHYSSLPFPFPLINAPQFYMEKIYSVEDFVNYLFSWSATQSYIREHKKNPLDLVKKDLSNAWKGEQERVAKWKLFMKIGRKPR